MKKIFTHGGARTGAGRTTEKSGSLTKVTLMLDEHTKSILKMKGNGNMSLGARRITKKMKPA